MDSRSESAVAQVDPGSSSISVELAVRCWGTRGSIPSPGPETAGYGGNTSCLSMRVGEQQFIFDAGTGIRLLGAKLSRSKTPVNATILLSHFHWDHIQGFPFFAPIHDPESKLEIVGPRQEDLDIESIFARQMSPVYFPIPFEAAAAELSFRHMNEDVWEGDGVTIRSMRVRHPSYVVAYRLDVPGASVCYVPDSELVGGDYPVGPKWRDRLVDFLGGANVLFHDAMFTAEEYPSRIGWGHSTFEQTVKLASECQIAQLYFFHHAPDRSDAELNRILERARLQADREAPDVSVNAAFEGKEIRIEER